MKKKKRGRSVGFRGGQANGHFILASLIGQASAFPQQHVLLWASSQRSTRHAIRTGAAAEPGNGRFPTAAIARCNTASSRTLWHAATGAFHVPSIFLETWWSLFVLAVTSCKKKIFEINKFCHRNSFWNSFVFRLGSTNVVTKISRVCFANSSTEISSKISNITPRMLCLVPRRSRKRVPPVSAPPPPLW